MRSHPSEYAPFCSDEGDFEVYCEKMSQIGVWGGQAELLASARVVGRPIKVVNAGTHDVVMGEDLEGPPLVVAYHRHFYTLGEHYSGAFTA